MRKKKVFFENRRNIKASLGNKFLFTIKIITAEQNDKLHKLYLKTIPSTQIFLFLTTCIGETLLKLRSKLGDLQKEKSLHSKLVAKKKKSWNYRKYKVVLRRCSNSIKIRWVIKISN